MKWLICGLAFGAGFCVGAAVAREIAIKKITDPVYAGVDALLGDNSYASGKTKQTIDSFIRK